MSVPLPFVGTAGGGHGSRPLDDAAQGRGRQAHQGRRPRARRHGHRAGPRPTSCARICCSSRSRASPCMPTCAGPAHATTTWRLAADRIYMSPEDVLDVKGLRAELMYFRNTLDKIGVQMQVYHIGKYKNAGDMFTQTTATPETREVMNSVLDTVYAYMVDVFAQRPPQESGGDAGADRQGPVPGRTGQAVRPGGRPAVRRPAVRRIKSRLKQRRDQEGQPYRVHARAGLVARPRRQEEHRLRGRGRHHRQRFGCRRHGGRGVLFRAVHQDAAPGGEDKSIDARDSAHRLAGRRRHRVRRDPPRSEAIARQEAAGDLDVGSGGLGRILRCR